MTISATTNRIAYAGNGATTVFSFPYPLFATSDLVVVEKLNSTGAETVRVLTTDYTVTIAADQQSASVTAVVAPPTGYTWVIYRDVPLTQGTDLVESGSLPAETLENTLDSLVLAEQRTRELASRGLHLTEGFTATFDMRLPVALTANCSVIINPTGDGWALGPTADAIAGAQGYATAAAASASAALASQSAAATSETNAATSAASFIFRDVVYLTSADSPKTLVAADRGKMFSVDATGGAVTINLPTIAGLTLTTPWTIAIKKTDASGNTVTIARASTDTIEGATSKTLSAQNAGCWLIPDTDQAPDQWATMDVGIALLTNNSVTYAIIQDVTAASRLIGRGSAAGAGDPQEIAPDGTTVEISATTLQVKAKGIGLAQMADGTQGGTLYYGASGVIAQLAAGTANGIYQTGGAGANPAWTLTPSGLTSISANTVTQASAAATATAINITSQATGDTLCYNAGWVRVAAGTAGQVFQANGAAAPTWTSTPGSGTALTSVTAVTLTQNTAAVSATAINITSQATGDILAYSSGWKRTAIGSTNAILNVTGGVPTWTLTPSGLTSISANTVTQASAASTATAINITSQATGDMLCYNAGWVRVAAGAAGALLTGNGAAAPTFATTLATQADQETGTSTTAYITPGRQHFHQSSAKAWAKCGFAGDLTLGYNVGSVTDTGTGIATVNFTTSLSTANGCGVASALSTSDQAVNPNVQASNVVLRCWNTSGTATDPVSNYYVAVYGDI